MRTFSCMTRSARLATSFRPCVICPGQACKRLSGRLIVQWSEKKKKQDSAPAPRPAAMLWLHPEGLQPRCAARAKLAALWRGLRGLERPPAPQVRPAAARPPASAAPAPAGFQTLSRSFSVHTGRGQLQRRLPSCQMSETLAAGHESI